MDSETRETKSRVPAAERKPSRVPPEGTRADPAPRSIALLPSLRTSSALPASTTDRAIGPGDVSDSEKEKSPRRLTIPTVGRNPTHEFKAAGLVIEAQSSTPTASMP